VGHTPARDRGQAPFRAFPPCARGGRTPAET
jgi:hypothetical protein